MTTLYAQRNHPAQGDFYLRHIDAMTVEGLNDKSAIAAELAHRDIEIERLRKTERSLEDQLVRIARCVGRDALGAPPSDPTIAGATIAEIESLRAAAAKDSESRAMFIARLENAKNNGEPWMTIDALLALLNDCDYLASRARTTAEIVECGANGSQGCSIKPCGPKGALQCEFCGAPPRD